MAGKISARYLGNISLCVAGGGFIALTLILHFRLVEGTIVQWLTILAVAFEAGTAGALADWFAVRALFREIPIPLMKKHTNIIVNSRSKFTKAVGNVVKTHLLTKESIEKELSKLSVSREIIGLLEKPDGRDDGITLLRKLLFKLRRNWINRN